MVDGTSCIEVTIPTGDGERLAGTLYLPDLARYGSPWAAVLEALPYRKDDITESYRPTYARYAAAGFAVLRLDLRGTGSSSGIATDEYPDVERTDLRAAIEWLAAQPWSNSRVGMFGTSYSGFNSLQMAAAIGELGVPALRAVVATYATDDRYTDDVHYCGGVLRAIDLIDYPLYMVAMNALPPVPALFGDGDMKAWRDEWQRRIDQTPAWLIEWLDNPTDAPTWRRGSIRLGPPVEPNPREADLVPGGGFGVGAVASPEQRLLRSASARPAISPVGGAHVPLAPRTARHCPNPVRVGHR